MISTPYRTLRDSLEMPEDWQPEWAENLQVRRHGDTTIYSAQPEQIDAAALTELTHLEAAGWSVTVDSQRLNRIRINIWQPSNH